MNRVALYGLFACVLASLSITRARAEEPDASALSVERVVALAREHNPSLKASLLNVESARWDVFGRDAEFDPVLSLGATGSQIASANAFGSSVRINRVRRGQADVALRKHLLWGTDLSLELSSSVQKSQSTGGVTLPPAMTGTTNALDPRLLGQFGLGNFGPLYGLSAKFSLKQPLWRGRGREVGEAARREARLSRTAAERTRDRVNSELLRDVLTAYWELWYADAALAIQEQAQTVAAAQRDQAAARAETGSLAPAEVLTFETQVATRDEDIVSARVERERRAHELARLIGSEREQSYGALSEPPFAERAFVREAVERAALSQSTEVNEQSSQVELARLRRKTADDPNKPRLDLEGYVQAQGLGNKDVADSANMFVGGDALSGLVSLTYEAPVRDRVRRATAAKARIAVDVAEQQLNETRQRVLSEVRVALDREASGRTKVELAERTSGIAARQLAAEQARYASGSSTSVAVLEAEDRARSAQLRTARARADLAESVLVLEHLTGELLERYASR